MVLEGRVAEIRWKIAGFVASIPRPVHFYLLTRVYVSIPARMVMQAPWDDVNRIAFREMNK